MHRTALPQSAPTIEVRQWHGTPISRRADGYVNATAMCKAYGRLFADYRRLDRTAQYLQALSRSMGNPIDLLVVVITTGPNHQRGTWVHPRIAVDLARWLHPEFAVWMDGWFLESLTPSPTTHHLPPAYKTGKPIKIHTATAAEAADEWFWALEFFINACHVDGRFSWSKFHRFRSGSYRLADRLGFTLLWEHVRD